jgi:lipopolysaccharide transport protein LptA
VAVYTGNVRASDPPDLDLASQSMSVRLETEGSGIRSVEAHEQVVITMREAKGGQRIGRGGQAAFDAVTGDVVLTESPTLETREGTLHADKLYLNRTENRLRATDRVRMELRRETMSGLGRREAGAGRAKPVTIHADAFDFEARANMATYTGNVRVDDLPDSELTARKVTAHMPEGGGGITRIVAEQDVVIHYHEEQNGKRVTRTGRGGRAVYEAAGESVVLTGNPSLETAEGRLSGEQVMLNRKDDRLAAKGRVRMELQQGATTGGKPGDKAIIQADDFEFDSARRVAKYAGNVRVEGLPDMDLACQHMLVHLAAEGGRIERLEADREVVIHYSELVEGKRAVRTATGDKAVYEAVTDTVVLTGNPVLETAEGKLFAQRVRLKRTEKHLAAEGAVRMEMKAGVTGGGNSRPGAAARRKPMTIHADAFEYSAAERVAHYRGNVRVDDLPEMELTCRNMTALVAPSGGGIERIVAEEDVVIDFHEERNGRHEKRTARGRRAVFESAADTVTLTGDPTVQVAEGTLTAEAIIYDRTLQLLRAVGERQIVGDPAVLRERNAARSPVKD